MRTCSFALGFAFFLITAVWSRATDPTYVRFNISVGTTPVTMDVEMLPTTPNTVANFLKYADSGAYNNSLIHRSVPGFVIQGGGYLCLSGTYYQINTYSTTLNSEAGVSNTCGTLAMALQGGATSAASANSGTDQWFFNEGDNSSLDTAYYANGAWNGPFTVFGVIANSTSLGIMNSIANVPVPNPGPYNPATQLYAIFSEIPLVNWTSGLPATQNFVTVNSITRLVHPAFFSGEAQLPNPSPAANQLKNSDYFYLQFANSKVFGYYNYNYFPTIYHTTLGWEYVIDAGSGAVYFYDYASKHFWYTNSTSYPYVYDFTLNAWLFYDTTSTSPRYFYNGGTGSWITE